MEPILQTIVQNTDSSWTATYTMPDGSTQIIGVTAAQAPDQDTATSVSFELALQAVSNA